MFRLTFKFRVHTTLRATQVIVYQNLDIVPRDTIGTVNNAFWLQIRISNAALSTNAIKDTGGTIVVQMNKMLRWPAESLLADYVHIRFATAAKGRFPPIVLKKSLDFLSLD